MKRIPITFLYPVLALPATKAAESIGISRKTLWKQTQMGKIKRMPYGSYAVTELERHLREDAKRA